MQKGIELERALRQKSKAKVKGTFKVMNKSFHFFHIGFCWRLEMFRDPIDNKCDMWPYVGGILKASN